MIPSFLGHNSDQQIFFIQSLSDGAIPIGKGVAQSDYILVSCDCTPDVSLKNRPEFEISPMNLFLA